MLASQRPGPDPQHCYWCAVCTSPPINYSDPGNNVPPSSAGRIKSWWKCKCSHIWTYSWWPVPYHQAILSSLHSAVCFRGGDMAGAGPGRRMWPLWETAWPLGAWRTTWRRQGRTGWKQRAWAPCLQSPGQRPAQRATSIAAAAEGKTEGSEMELLDLHAGDSKNERSWKRWSGWGLAVAHGAGQRGQALWRDLTIRGNSRGPGIPAQSQKDAPTAGGLGRELSCLCGRWFRDQAGLITLQQWSPEATIYSEGSLLLGLQEVTKPHKKV